MKQSYINTDLLFAIPTLAQLEFAHNNVFNATFSFARDWICE